jgi:cytochrome P450
MAYRSATLDIIMEYLFAQCYDAISTPHFQNSIIVSIQASVRLFPILKHFPLLASTLNMLPGWLIVKLNPSALGFVRVRETCQRHADEVLSNPEEKLHNASHEIIYHHLVTSDLTKRSKTPSKDYLSREAHSLLGAGSDTVGGTCTIGTFHVVNDRVIGKKLRAELDEARKEKGLGKDENLRFEVLEKLPYLTAVIKESLRLSYGVVTPLPRVVGPEDSVIDGYEVPKGVRNVSPFSFSLIIHSFLQTVVAISTTFIHNNPVFFPNPFKFDPERWLKGPESKALDKWLVPFSTGPRQCLGIKYVCSHC